MTEVAAVSGALAVLFGVVQLVFPALVHWWWVSGIEVGVAIVALLVVLFGVRAAIQFNWLLERHRAERLRQLKFAVLIHEDLWCGRFEAWQGHVRHEVQALQHIERKGMEDWADRDRIPLPEKNTAGCALGAGPLQALAGYYIAKRLGYQMSYFARRSQKHGGQDRWLRHWPAWCFYGSVAAVALHYLLDVAPCCAAGVGWLSQAFMLLALALPVVGACIRTVRVARELGRSAALFRAKHAALQDLLQRMLTELAAVPVHSEAVVHSVAACEDFLKAEQREWLRLMREAEWFG